ncbi:hypothetical protein D3C81_1689030 [compost metagenome]
MQSFSTSAPILILAYGFSAAATPPTASYLSWWTLVMTCIRPCAPTPLSAYGLKLDSMAITPRISSGSMPTSRPVMYAAFTSWPVACAATRYLRAM